MQTISLAVTSDIQYDYLVDVVSEKVITVSSEGAIKLEVDREVMTSSIDMIADDQVYSVEISCLSSPWLGLPFANTVVSTSGSAEWVLRSPKELAVSMPNSE